MAKRIKLSAAFEAAKSFPRRTIDTDPCSTAWIVQSESDSDIFYKVEITDSFKWTCSCPSFKGTCKHIVKKREEVINQTIYEHLNRD